MEPTRDEIVAWVNRALAQTGDTPSALARRAGLATTTLTRFLHDQGSPMLSLRSIAKIAHVAGEAPIGVPTGDELLRGELRETEAVPFDYGVSADWLNKALEALKQGRRSANPWLLQSRALDAIGYLPNDILIVDLNEKPETGQIVCAQSYNWAKGNAETVFRLLEAPYLVAATTDLQAAQHVRKPLLVDNDRIIIKGVVIASLRVSVAPPAR